MTQEMPTRPGGPLQQKPIEIDGVTYDPFHPPKMIRNEDGSTGWIGGKPLAEAEKKEEDGTGKPEFQTTVEAPALTTTHLFQAASTMLKTNPNMSPEDRAKYFRQMAEYVAKQLEENKIY